MSLATAGIILASLTSVVVAGAPAQAVARCTSDGKPKATSGKFKNRAGHTMMVKGDALVNGRFKTVERPVRKEGGTA